MAKEREFRVKYKIKDVPGERFFASKHLREAGVIAAIENLIGDKNVKSIRIEEVA